MLNLRAFLSVIVFSFSLRVRRVCELNPSKPARPKVLAQ